MSFWNSHTKKPDSTLPNILPLVEISLFLIMALIANANSASLGDLHGELADVRKAQSTEDQDSPPVLRVSVTSEGKYLDWDESVTLDELQQKIAHLPDGAGLEIVPNKLSKFQAIADVMSAAYARGIKPTFQVEVFAKEAAR